MNEQIKELKEIIEKSQQEFDMLRQERDDYKERIDKAIGYMQRLESLNNYWGYLNFTNGDRNSVLKILRGDKNENM